MPRTIIPQNQDGRELHSTIFSFLRKFDVGGLLHRCNAHKEKGVPVGDIFRYKLCNVFSDRSMYMQQKTGVFRENFSKNTFYRFLNSPKTNWLRFTSLLSKNVADTIKPLTGEDRVSAFIVDDSLYERAGCEKTELASRVFDHVSTRCRKGYRLLTLGWTDGNTFLPVNGSLLSSPDEGNVIGAVKKHDGRTLAAKRRKLARTKATGVMTELLGQALSAGHGADYVLLDTWFANPAQLIAVKGMGLDSIAMVRKSSTIHYECDGERLPVKKIFSSHKKRRGRSRYLLSVDVMVGKEEKIPAKIVCVRNRNNRKDWVALISTDTSLPEEEIIRIYGKRWQIEVFFKTCKSYLNLTGECHSLSYDALTAHVAIVFTRYMIIAAERRRNEDWRSAGEIFFLFTDEMADVTFAESLRIIVTAMTFGMSAVFRPTESQMDAFITAFFGRLPEYLRNILGKAILRDSAI